VTNVLDNIDRALHDWDTSPDAMRWVPERAPEPPAPVALTSDQIQALSRVFSSIGAQVAAGIARLSKAFQQFGAGYLKIAHRVIEHDRVRCRVCRPYSNPRPLAFGAEYHRRQKRRNR
jgi:asparagine synthetase B (glutamine-hydrolysing)